MRTKVQQVAFKNRVAFFKKYKIYRHPDGPALRCFPKPTGFFKTPKTLGYTNKKQKTGKRVRFV